MRFTTSQTSFHSGRLSPKLYNRVDTKQYRDGASILEGFKVLPEGGVDRLKGIRVINTGTSMAGVDVVESRIISACINGKPVVLTLVRGTDNSVWATPKFYPFEYTISGSSFRLIKDGLTMYPLDEFDWTVHDTYIILVHFSGKMMPTYIKIHTGELGPLTQPWEVYHLMLGPTDANGGMASSQITDTHPVFKLPMTDIGSNQNELTTTWDINTQLMDITATDTETISLLQTKTAVIYLENLGTVSSLRMLGSDFYFKTADITNGIRVMPTVLYTSGSKFDPISIGLSGATGKIRTWAVSQWYPNNWPKTVTSYESRVVFGGTPNNPLTFYGSKLGKATYFNQLRRQDTMHPEVIPMAPYGAITSSDPYVFTVGAKEDSTITFLQSTDSLVLGTDRREHIADGGDTTLSPLSITMKSPSAQGSMPVSSCTNGTSVYYISNGGKQLYRFKYNDTNGSFISEEISLLFSDLIDEDLIKQVEWCPNISSIMILMQSGKLYGIMDNSTGNTTAFFDTKLTDIASIGYLTARKAPEWGRHTGDSILLHHRQYGLCSFEQLNYERTTMEGNKSGVVTGHIEDNAYLFYDRVITMNVVGPSMFDWNGQSINGSGYPNTVPVPYKLYGNDPVYVTNMETKETIYTSGNAVGDWVYVPVPESFVSGPNWFVIGADAIPCMVATMPIEAGQQWGTAQMGVKNIDAIAVRHYKTYSFEVSSDTERWEEVVVVDGEGNCTTGRKDKKFTSSPKHDQIVYLRNTKAEPVTIVGINMRGVSNDG